MDVSGQGSTLNTTGTGVIGAGGSGTLDITNGGVVNDGNTTIAQNPGSTGTVDVSGPGSTSEQPAGSSVIGGSGSGTLGYLQWRRRQRWKHDHRTEPRLKRHGGCLGTGIYFEHHGNRHHRRKRFRDPGYHQWRCRERWKHDHRTEHRLQRHSGCLGTGIYFEQLGKLRRRRKRLRDTGYLQWRCRERWKYDYRAESGVDGHGRRDGVRIHLEQYRNAERRPAGIGTLDVIDGGAVTANGGTTVGPNGTVTGDGTITTPTLVNNGTVAPAGANNTPGTIATLNGNYQQGPGGVLDSEVGGPQSSQADQLKISGTATLNGTLTLTSLHNFHPSSGDTYTILTAAGGLTGKFNQVVDTLNTNGLTRTDVIGPNGVLVSYLRPVPKPPPATPSASPAPPASITLTTPNPLPTTPLTAAQKNAILVPIVNPNVDQLAAPFEV